ncbi:MAG: tRNA 2-thiouridine(34) synthase MnmA [Treponema sp.]|jgi:tRNA-specific 2-thiouridylase|nr:tRNA 2-thiouridine(34) synthase MnmA [Treponema sp.]
MAKRALIAMSGGVDSAVAAILMRDSGCECVGATMKLTASGGSRCCSLADINDARSAAWKLGIPHYVMNYTEDFTRYVIEPFIASYERGETPNPCVECNRRLKFSLLLRRALELEAEILATGHYARIEWSGSGPAGKPAGSGDPRGRWLLKKGADEKKDQSYVLYMMTQEQLERTRFPLGALTKAEVREIAARRGLDNADKKESQDICFAGGGDYAAFIEAYTGRRSPEGDIVDAGGTAIGRHRGLIRYTLGQRRGTGVARGVPVYVAEKDTARNVLVLGPEESLYSKTLTAKCLNLIACESLETPLRLGVKTRYLQKEQSALVRQTGPDTVLVEFSEPQRALTPGQAAVFYDGDVVVGGGTITG